MKLISLIAGVVMVLVGYCSDPRIMWLLIVGAILIFIGGGWLLVDLSD